MVFKDPQVNLYSADVPQAIAFYCEHFGFVETFRTPTEGTPQHVELRLGGLVLGIASIKAAIAVHGLPAGSGPARAEIVLWTDEDVDTIYADLLAKGVPPLIAPHDFIGRLRAAWVQDPDGVPVQIVREIAPQAE